MKSVWAEHALTSSGWQSGVRVDFDDRGVITAVNSGTPAAGLTVSLLLPSPANLHSHAFQRAMAGLTESRGPEPHDTFWTWRKLMFSFLDKLNPDDVEIITAFAQMEMLEAGFSSVGEFHYLHHQPDGSSYTNLAEMSERVASAAEETGIGLTLLPVLYEHGGCDGRPLVAGQKRFANSPDQYAALTQKARQQLELLPGDTNDGVAPHSLRAVSRSGLDSVVEQAGRRPVHIHVAEQSAEVDEIVSAWRARPVEWLLENQAVDKRWCVIHATQMVAEETAALAATGAVAGLCPVTESSLGDGVFDGMRFQRAGGRWGIGSDSNIRISLAEELRTLEYSQRLRDRGRAMHATADHSTGRMLLETALRGGARALQRNTGKIEVGCLADLMVLDADTTQLMAMSGDGWLDAWIFSGDDSLVTDVWSAGRHQVKNGRHINREAIEQRYRKCLRTLVADL